MEIKKFLINEKTISISILDNTIKNLCVTINNLEYEAKIIQFDQYKKLLFFEINKRSYKAKIISIDLDEISLYIFNTQSQITVNTRQHNQEKPEDQEKFIPGSLSTFSDQANLSQLKSPLAGRVIKVLVTQGQQVAAYQPIIIIESMKMENEICAPYNAFIKTLSITEGNLVQQNQVLVTFGEIQGEIEGENDGATKNVDEQTAIQNR